MTAKTQRQKYDMKAPGTRELVDEIVHGTFVKEGTMVAICAGFPGAAAPIRADEGRITALDATADGAVYGGTSGRAAHLFVGWLHGMTGIAFDMGTVDGATRTAAVCCTEGQVVAGANGPDGGRLVGRPLEPMPFDLIQEWGFARTPFTDLGRVGDGEPIVHAVACDGRRRVVGVSEANLFAVDPRAGTVDVLAPVAGCGRLGVDAKGHVVGRDEADRLWVYIPGSRALERRAVRLPRGAWDGVALTWARDPRDGRLVTADGDGRLFAWDGAAWSECLGRAPLTPVGPMAITVDGRLYGFCGEGIARLFGWDPAGGQVRDIGVAASVYERRRYGYSFGDAVVGRDGEIVFGEDDDLGHLWLYFPRLQGARLLGAGPGAAA